MTRIFWHKWISLRNRLCVCSFFFSLSFAILVYYDFVWGSYFFRGYWKVNEVNNVIYVIQLKILFQRIRFCLSRVLFWKGIECFRFEPINKNNFRWFLLISADFIWWGHYKKPEKHKACNLALCSFHFLYNSLIR